eukprot:CAMPEP_0113587866 /NCGR_PEP_ID=MMETSP0015_2-20120614/35165_1 /TAXON_ID=2838 /ORGANISM="Odontella" /LENGTH=197 /DNA_ID=CAMNT_0000493611 /DNA_START=106 /DNA_END=697 /DNA_ORIENTATION=+ /assembly_acc=CAM_ASM_000160
MNICISLLLFVCTEGFSLLALPSGRNKHARSSLRKDVSGTTSSPYKSISFALSGDSNGSDDKLAGADNDLDDYDFERGFQERLKKEGGETGVKVKAAKRSVDVASKQVANQAKQSVNTATAATKGASDSLFKDLGLLSQSEWGLTLGALALVVVLAIGTQVASPPKSFADLSTKDQIERLNRAEPKVTEMGIPFIDY